VVKFIPGNLLDFYPNQLFVLIKKIIVVVDDSNVPGGRLTYIFRINIFHSKILFLNLKQQKSLINSILNQAEFIVYESIFLIGWLGFLKFTVPIFGIDE